MTFYFCVHQLTFNSHQNRFDEGHGGFHEESGYKKGGKKKDGHHKSSKHHDHFSKKGSHKKGSHHHDDHGKLNQLYGRGNGLMIL
jgi:hypothetical protein